MKILTIAGLVTAGLLTVSPLGADMASAGSANLQCQGGFEKVATYANAIKCRRVHAGFPHKLSALRAAHDWAEMASCNAHMGTPQEKVWKPGSKWKARVTFICANIT
jgi:hypothetical protein